MKKKRTMNQLGLAPMRMPKTRASWIDEPVPIIGHIVARAPGGPDACDDRGMQPDDLYGLPLDRFIAERGALAKALRGEDRRDEAAEVAKLRKPSAAAWAVNQLVRTQGRAVGELFDAGDAVRA